MSLRIKCAILLIAFELTIAATLFITFRVIRTYFEDAAQAISSSSQSSMEIRRLRRLLRDEFNLLDSSIAASGDSQRDQIALAIEAAAHEVRTDETLAQLAQDSRDRETLATQIDGLLAQRAAALYSIDAAGLSNGARPTDFDGTAHLELDRVLAQWESDLFDHLTLTAQGSFSTFYQSVLILSVNMIVGALLGILGLILMRRWVLLPIIDLTHAADQFGRGRFDHRAKVHSHDELGHLATAMNGMSADINRLNQQMVYRERAAAMGELISYIAHNIRNPLAGIRSVSESCKRSAKGDVVLLKQHDEIVNAVDRLQRWLREVEHACRPLELRPQMVSASDLIDGVLSAFRPMAARRAVELSARLSPEADVSICVDPSHFEQALAAVVGNAIEACQSGDQVKIELTCSSDGAYQEVAVIDTGPGIPEEMRDYIFQPSVSSKREGTGLGLAMARRVAALHGGELTFECPPNGGTVFRFRLPFKEIQEDENG